MFLWICYSTHWCVQCVSLAGKPVINVHKPDGEIIMIWDVSR